MKVFTLVLFSLFLIFLEVRDVSSADQLLSVVALFRNGLRSISTSYPKDQYKDAKYWPEGYNQLLNAGKLQQYNLGKWLRNRYQTFLSNNYHKKEFKIFSAGADASLMSAETTLAGLYQPAGDDQWLKGLPWEPVPISTMPEEEDAYVSITRPCPAYFKIYNDLRTSKYFSDILKENAELINYLNENTGWKIEDLDYVRGIYSIRDIYSRYNETFVPTWMTKLNNTLFANLSGIAWVRDTWTPEMKRWMTGPFFGQFFSHHEAFVKNREDEPKFYTVSASSIAVGAILNTMDVFDNVPPPFSATILWELYKTNSGSHYFKIFQKGDGSDVKELKPKACGTTYCEYGAFKNLLHNYTIYEIEEWEKECYAKNGDGQSEPLLRKRFGF